MPIEEKNLFEKLISDSNISKLNHIRYDQNEIDELVNRYNIIKGEILVGNDNPKLLKELKVIIMKLMNYNILKLNEITPLLQELFLLI